MKKICLIVYLFLVATFLFSVDEEETSGLSILPVIMHSPETGWGLGAYVLRYREAYDMDTPGLANPMNMYSAVGLYTTEKQIRINISAEHYLSPDYQGILEIDLRKYPNQYCGIGNDTTIMEEEDYTDNSLEFELGVMRDISGSLSIGPNYRVLRSYITRVENGGALDSGFLPGSESFTVHGIGLKAAYDVRNAVIFPTSGYLIQAQSMQYHEGWGSDFTFSKSSLDARAYYTLFKKHVLAFQYVYLFTDGSAPFQELAELCDHDTMRGFYEGRYRDHNALMLQAEYRFPLFYRFGAAVFGGVGDVASRFDKFSSGDPKVAGGVGFRYAWDTKQNLNIRLDISYNNASDRYDDSDQSEMRTGLYFNVKEAF